MKAHNNYACSKRESENFKNSMKETLRSKEAIKAWPSEIAMLNKIVSEQTKSYKNKAIEQLNN